MRADLRLVNRRPVSYRAVALARQDAMLASKPLNNMLGVLWTTDRCLGVKESRELRASGRFRFKPEKLWNRTEQRYHYNYLYSVRGTIRCFADLLGLSGLVEVDRLAAARAGIA